MSEPDLARYKEIYGTTLSSPEWKFVAARDPEFVRRRTALASYLFSPTGRVLPLKYRELLHVCILAFRAGPEAALDLHLRRARAAGASTMEILEALETIMIAGGLPATFRGLTALVRLESSPLQAAARRRRKARARSR